MIKTEEGKAGTFWEGKMPCWTIRDCIPAVRQICSAFFDQTRPCWKQETPCKRLLGVSTCFSCEVWKRYATK